MFSTNSIGKHNVDASAMAQNTSPIYVFVYSSAFTNLSILRIVNVSCQSDMRKIETDFSIRWMTAIIAIELKWLPPQRSPHIHSKWANRLLVGSRILYSLWSIDVVQHPYESTVQLHRIARLSTAKISSLPAIVVVKRRRSVHTSKTGSKQHAMCTRIANTSNTYL